MKTSKRVRRNGSAKAAAQQAPTSKARATSAAPAIPQVHRLCKWPAEMVNTGTVAREFENALAALRQAKDAAIALVFIQADLIAEASHALEDFEKYDVHGFKEGVPALAAALMEKAKQSFPAFCEEGLQLANALGLEDKTVPCLDLRDIPTSQMRGHGFFDFKISKSMEETADALAGCLRHFGDVLCTGNMEGAWRLSNFTADNLEASLRDCLQRRIKLLCLLGSMAAGALVAAENPERKAA